MKEHKSLTPSSWLIAGQLVTLSTETWPRREDINCKDFQPLKAQNVDGSANQRGVICHKITLHLQIAKTEEKREFLVVNCGQENLILGLPWLQEINLIDWTTGEVTISSIPRTPQHDSSAAIIQQYLIWYLGMEEIVTSPMVQLMRGLISWSQGSPRIKFSWPQLTTRNSLFFSVLEIWRWRVTLWQITPPWFALLSTFCALSG